MLDLLREFAAAAGAGDLPVQRGHTPDGRDFLGVRCPGGYEVRQALWDRLREQHPRTGFWPFVSHEGPEEWEWSPAPQKGVEPPVDSGTLDRIVAAQGPDVAGFLQGPPDGEDFEGVEALIRRVRSATAAQEPYARGALIRRVFAYPPEWVCVVAVGPSVHDLPQVLHAPDALSWPGPAAFPTLTYADHSAVLANWHARYGVVPFYLGHTAMVLQVDRPPADPDEIARVAVEQFAYCPDLFEPIGDPTDIATRQVPSRHWYFRWR